MLGFTMMTDQPHPPLEATPMLTDVSLVPHMLSVDGMQQMILVQVNPGETFTIRTEDGLMQCIAGPAQVPMVSPNGTVPPIFVPYGYMSQVVEENGMRKVVVLPHAAEFHPSMPLPPLHMPQYLPPHPAMLHQHHIYPREMPPHFIHQLPPPQMFTEQDMPCHSTPLPPRDERAAKLQEHLNRRPNSASVRLSRSPPPSPLKAPPATSLHNGHNGHNKGAVTPAASPGPAKARPLSKTRAEPEPEGNAERDVVSDVRTLMQFLSSMCKPTVQCVTPRSAVLSWAPPALVQNGDASRTPPPLALTYELTFSQSGIKGSFSSVYIGPETTFMLEDLRPASEYCVRVCASCGSAKGPPSEAASFTTQSAPPDAPVPPRLIVRSRSSLVLQWKAPNDNGSKITGYLLEYDEGKQSAFKEIYFGHAKQYKIIRLTPATKYAFRVAAKNDAGMSPFSEVLTCCTAGSVPQPPAPPRLADVGVSWLLLEWSAPCGPAAGDAFTYTLEMEEEGTGYGFKPTHNGEETSYTVKGLQRHTSYKFRVLAANAEGRSQPSAAAEFRTLPDQPGSPGRPSVKTPVHPRSLHAMWDAPQDDGGSDIQQYVLEMCQNHGGIAGSQWTTVYSGPLREHLCDSLEPGTWYNLRVHCRSAGGQSQVSDSLSIQTAPVPPGPCQALQLGGKAKPQEIPLTWGAPLWDGGAPVSQYAVEIADSVQEPHRPVYQGLETDCTASHLLPGHSYCFWVKAANQAGWGPLSDMCELFTAPGPPERCAPPELTLKTATCVLATWEVPACNGAKVSDFRLEWGAAEGSLTLTYCGPAPSYEARGLLPATIYYCRVQAVNSAGAGPFGDVAMVTTPPSVPAAVRLVEVVGEDALLENATGLVSTCLALRWEEPCCNGSEITGYNIDFGEQLSLSVGRTNHHVLENLQPDTTYRVRVQAVNSVGAGPFSSILKAKTRPLPPEPPVLECVAASPQSLKLKWGDGPPSRTQLSGATQFCLHMQASADRLVCIYSGPCHTFKVQRLAEATLYHFSIQAHNEAGVGPLSALYSFSTSHSPPGQLKAPRIEQLEGSQCEVTWEALQPMKGDPIVYTLQLQRGRELEQLYRGPAALFRWQGVAPGCEWRLRVCAGRKCPDGSELWGPYSPSAALPVPEPQAASDSGTRVTSRDGAAVRTHRAITDEQFALLLLLSFATVAILFAVVIQYFVIK